jgi:sulfide-dependent adenosine diphosphate thiazole synthase
LHEINLLEDIKNIIREDVLDEIVISRAITQSYMQDLMDYMEVDVAVVGGGPSGLAASYYLSKQGIKTAIFEKRLSIGGGMWGGGMMFNKIVVQDEAKHVLDEFGITYKQFQEGYYVADAIESVSAMCYKSVKAGTRVFNLIMVEDVMIREDDRVAGLVLNWTAVEMAKLHVDPLTIRSKFVIDATGHDAEVCNLLARKTGRKVSSETGAVIGEKPMWAEIAEREIVNHTGEVYPGLLSAGMVVNAVHGLPRMGPIFGGMLLSGKKVAGITAGMLKSQ